MSIVDGVVLPSYREGMPRSLLEASSSGLPIIGSNVPGINQLIQNNYNGILVDAKNAKSIADAMKRFIYMDFDTKKQMGLNGRKVIEEKYTIDKVLCFSGSKGNFRKIITSKYKANRKKQELPPLLQEMHQYVHTQSSERRCLFYTTQI